MKNTSKNLTCPFPNDSHTAFKELMKAVSIWDTNWECYHLNKTLKKPCTADELILKLSKKFKVEYRSE